MVLPLDDRSAMQQLGVEQSCSSRIIANIGHSRLLSAIAPWSTWRILSKVR
jgi:hypothetical protein